MTTLNQWFQVVSISCLITAATAIARIAPAYAITFVNSLTIPGETTDLSGLGNGANLNRFGGAFSDLYYDRANNVYYGLSDRGPGGGVYDYFTRVQKFTLDVNPQTGAISNFNLLQTILFTKDGQNFNGLNPTLLNGNSSILGLSQDPEGFAIAPNGNFYVSDEYGPSVYEYKPDGTFVRAFEIPQNILPKVGSTLNFVDGRGTITSGRQDNRGFEGLAITPDGSKLYAMLQDPLVNEGASNDGRNSRNLRIVVFDTATGKSSAQYIYPLESLDSINNRIPGTADDFAATAQGRNIGISAIVALNDKEFLVLERDNRGIGVDDPLGTAPVASKRVYKIDITGATDVTNISLAGTNTLPDGVVPVKKDSIPFLDIAAKLQAAGLPVPEKLEGLAVGPQLADGSYALLLGTDNDFSVTQNSTNVQFNVCIGGGSSTQVAIDGSCPAGKSLLPTFLYSFKVGADELGNYQPAAAVPEPTTMIGAAAAGLGGLWLRRKRQAVKAD
jgi:hypothetical protein